MYKPGEHAIVVSDRSYDRKYMFLAEETKPDYRYCRPEVHVPCRGNQARLQVVDRKYMFFAEETMLDYMYCRPEVMFLAEGSKPDYRYCRLEVHVPCRGNQTRLQVL